MQNLQTVRGMHDILPEKSGEYVMLETRSREIFSKYGYSEIRTPVLESVALFKRAIGEATDIVEKEMFTLKDRGDRELCMRPEGTAGVVRSFIEHSLDQKCPLIKLFYMGPMFRAERPQKGRYREFVQIGSEYFGNPSPSADAESMNLVVGLIKSFGLNSTDLKLNSIGCSECRPKYLEVLVKYLKEHVTELCDHCKSRLEKNPLRVLDCKRCGPNILKSAPKTMDHLCENCKSHHSQVESLLKVSGTKFILEPGLVRGLDYYTRTVFEVYPSGETGSQDALAAGGRYDTLVKNMGGKSVPAVGFALGVERILNQLAASHTQTRSLQNPDVFVASIGSGTLEKAFQVLQDLRQAGISADGSLNGQSLKSQMRLADKLGVKFCVIIGEDELKEGVAQLKNFNKQSQKKVPINELVSVLKGEST